MRKIFELFDWERGRLARSEREHAALAKQQFALRAQCGRDARAPSKELRLSAEKLST